MSAHRASQSILLSETFSESRPKSSLMLNDAGAEGLIRASAPVAVDAWNACRLERVSGVRIPPPLRQTIWYFSLHFGRYKIGAWSAIHAQSCASETLEFLRGSPGSDQFSLLRIQPVPLPARLMPKALFARTSRFSNCVSGDSITRARQRHFYATVLGAAVLRIIRSDRICVAESLCRDQRGVDSVGDHKLHHVIGTLLRQY